MTPEIQKLLADLAHQLGVAVPHLYTVLTRQMVLEGWTALAYDLTVLAVFTALAVKCWRFAAKTWHGAQDGGLDAAWFFGVGTLALLAGLIALVDASEVVKDARQIINPEYYAIERVLHLVAR